MKIIYDCDWYNELMFFIEKGYISDEGIICLGNKNWIIKVYVGVVGWRYWVLLKVFWSLWLNFNGGFVNVFV